MKIAFVTPAYYPAIIGAALYCTELAEGLTKKGHKVKIFTPWKKGMKKFEAINGVEIERIPKHQVTESFYVSGKMVRAILAEKFDIIHSHHYGYFPATAGLLASKISKTPHVFGPYYHPPVYGTKRWLMFSAYHATQGLPLLRFSDKVLPHTRFEAKMLVKLGARPENIEVLPNIVDTKRFSPGKKRKQVLFVSTLLREKGAHIAMDIAERILSRRTDTDFVFVGKALDKDLEKRVKRLSSRKNIKFLSNIPGRELARQYAQSLVFFLPSKYEAFGRVIAEAEACACCVVATRVGGIPEVVNDKKSGFLVEYGDWASMEKRINFLLDNPRAAGKMGRAGFNYVKRKFEKDIVVDKLERIYEQVLDEKQRKRV